MSDTPQNEGKQILWFVRRKNQIRGPFPSGTLRRFLILGRVRLSDKVSQDKEHWQIAAKIPEVIPPELRKEIAAGVDIELLSARLREDERSGRERRAAKVQPEIEKRRQGERRQQEEEISLTHRHARELLIQESAKQRIPAISILLTLLILISAVGYGIYLGGPAVPGDPDCVAAPAPRVNWRNCQLDGIKAESVDLRGAVLNNARMTHARMSGAILTETDLQYADLSLGDLSYANISNARLKGVSLRHADLTNTEFTNADLSFADLTDARIGGAIFTDARLDNAIWVDGRTCSHESIGTCR